MASMLLWIGLTFCVGLQPALSAFNVSFPLAGVIGGILMVVGCVLLAMGK